MWANWSAILGLQVPPASVPRLFSQDNKACRGRGRRCSSLQVRLGLAEGEGTGSRRCIKIKLLQIAVAGLEGDPSGEPPSQ